jgi:hypothetical protein
MDPPGAGDQGEASRPQLPPLEWRFAQVFGERAAGEDVQEGTSVCVRASSRSTRFVGGSWVGPCRRDALERSGSEGLGGGTGVVRCWEIRSRRKCATLIRLR